MTHLPLARLLLAALLPLLPAGTAPRLAPAPGAARTPRAERAERVPLAGAQWTLDAEPAPPPQVAGEPDALCVTLPFGARGERWATVFCTTEPGTARLLLDHRGGPDGPLYEVVLDGQRLTPARDAWRPSPRDLRTDLGPVWLGQGSHLIEFVAREQPVGEAALRPRALELTWT